MTPRRRWLLGVLLLPALVGCRWVQEDPLPRWETRASQSTLQALQTPGTTLCLSGLITPGPENLATLTRTRPPTFPAVDLVGISTTEATALQGQRVEICGVSAGLVSPLSAPGAAPRPLVRLQPAPATIGPPLLPAALEPRLPPLPPDGPPGWDGGSTRFGPGPPSPQRDRNAPYSRPVE